MRVAGSGRLMIEEIIGEESAMYFMLYTYATFPYSSVTYGLPLLVSPERFNFLSNLYDMSFWAKCELVYIEYWYPRF